MPVAKYPRSCFLHIYWWWCFSSRPLLFAVLFLACLFCKLVHFFFLMVRLLTPIMRPLSISSSTDPLPEPLRDLVCFLAADPSDTGRKKPKLSIEGLSQASYFEPNICWKSSGITIVSPSGNCLMPLTHWSSHKYCHPHRALVITLGYHLVFHDTAPAAPYRPQYSSYETPYLRAPPPLVGQVSLLILGATLKRRVG
jgi:hypothetical protein